VVDFVEKGEQILQNFQKTMAELSAQSKKINSVVNTVEQLKFNMETIKLQNKEGQGTRSGHPEINISTENDEESDSMQTYLKSKRPVEETSCQRANKRSKSSHTYISSGEDDTDNENLDNFLSSQKQKDTKDSEFLQELEDLFEEKEVTGVPVSERLSKIVNKSMRAEFDEKRLKDLKEKHRRPVNTDQVQTPRIEPFIWRDLPTLTKAVDAKMQRAVSNMSACLVTMIRALDIIQEAETIQESGKRLGRGHLQDDGLYYYFFQKQSQKRQTIEGYSTSIQSHMC
jgi:hypothetical protein